MRKAFVLAGLAGIAACTSTALAQPAVFTDLGDRSTTQTFTQAVTLTAANDIQWYKVILPVADNAMASYVDMWGTTSGLPDALTDPEIGIYDNLGNLVANDDDSDDGLFSQLTFGLTAPTRPPNGTGLAFNGRNGTLPAGTYWVAVGRFNVTFGATNWTVTSSSTSTQRTTNLNFRIQAAGTPVPPSGVGSATPNAVAAGGNSLLTVATTPGANPPSTNITVTGDLSALGGSATQMFFDDGTNGDVAIGDGTHSFAFTTSNMAAPALYNLPFTVADAEMRSGTGNIALTIIPPPPGNDECANAFTAMLGTNNFDNSAATTSQSVTCVTDSRDIFYTFNPPNTGQITVSTIGGTTQDTTLSAFDVCGGTQLACNDDTGGLQSRISFCVTQNVPVIIRLARFGTGGAGSAGTFTIAETLAVPSVNAFADVSCGGPGTVITVEADATGAACPDSPIATVVCDATVLDGGSVNLLDDGVAPDVTAGDGTFTGTVTVGPAAVTGNMVVTATTADARSATDTLAHTVPSGVDEAGDLPATAAVPAGSGPLTQITGTLDAGCSGDDVDMYLIQICDPATFSATTFPGTSYDTQLFLFDVNGVGVTFNDDIPDGFPGDATLQSLIGNGIVGTLPAGNYYLAVSRFDKDPQDSTPADLWIDTPFNTERAPDGAGAANAVNSWTAITALAGPYTVDLTGACFSGCTVTCDVNGDGGADNADVFDLSDSIAGGTPLPNPGACKDYNQDGSEDNSDIFDMSDAIASGTCP